MSEDNTQDILDDPEPAAEEVAPTEPTDTPVPADDATPVAPLEVASDEPSEPTPPAEPSSVDPLAELDKQIDSLDVLDEDAMRGTLKRVLSTAADAHKRAEAAENRSKNAAIYAERDTGFAAAAKQFGVSKIEAEREFDKQYAAAVKLGHSGEKARLFATARWEMALESKKDQPQPTVRAAAPAAPRQTVTRAGASAIPRGGTAPPPPAPRKAAVERVGTGDYGNLENL